MLVAWIVVTFMPAVAHWAQGFAVNVVNRAAHAHGDAWQNGAVKNWVASGQVTMYRYDSADQQSQDTFPVTLLHQSDSSGGGSQSDKLQRLIFRSPELPIDNAGPSGPTYPNPFSVDKILTREGTDGTDQWHSAGPLSTKASGHAARFIESQDGSGSDQAK